MYIIKDYTKTELFEVNNKFYQPNKGVAMGSPISGPLAEIFLQYHEQYTVKNILDNNKMNFYNRYVDDIIIIFDNANTSVDEISNYMNNLHKHLQFKSTEEENNTISFLDLLITRNYNGLSINIYRKATTTDTTIHFNSNHPMKHKMAAYRFLLNRLHQLPISQDQKQKEMNTIHQIARKNGYPITIIDKLNKHYKQDSKQNT
jgi:hypothetical protein